MLTHYIRSFALAAGLTAAATCHAFDASTAYGADIERAQMFLSCGHGAGALDCVEQALALASPDETTAWLQAEALYNSARFAEARLACSALLCNYPATPLRAAAQLIMGDCLLQAGDYAQALAEYARIDTQQLSADDAGALNYRKGVALFCRANAGEGTFAAAEAAFAGVQGGRYGNISRFMRAQCLSLQGKPREAYEMMPAYVEQIPRGEYDYYRARMALAAGDFSAAARAAQSALSSLSPQSPQSSQMKVDARRICGESLYRTGRTEEGLSRLRQYLSECNTPQASALLLVGTDDYRKGDYDTAVSRLEGATDAEGIIGQTASLMLGQALMHTGRRQASILAFDKAIHADAGDDAVRQAAYYNYAAASAGGVNVPFGSSARIFEQFLTEYPAGPYSDRVRTYLADGYIAEGNYERALQRLQNMRGSDPAVAASRRRALYLLGMRELANGNAAQALIHFDNAAAIAGNDDLRHEITLAQARALEECGHGADAATKYGTYLRQAPANAANRNAARYRYAYTLYNLRRYPEAERQFAQAASAFSGVQLADILNRRADIAYYQENFGNAEALYRQALAADAATGDYAAFNAARMAGFQRNYEQKLDEINAFLRNFSTSPLVPEALLEKTQALLSLGHKADAVTVYRQLIADYPLTSQSRRGYLQLAMTLLDMERRDEAAEAYRQVIRHYPSSAEAAQASGLLRQIYALEGRGDEYLAFMESVEGAPTVERSDAAELQYGSAMRAFRNGDHGTALLSFLEQYPDAPRAEDALATVAQRLYDDGEIPRSLALWQQLQQRASSPAMTEKARLGIMRAARDTGDNELAGNTAAQLLQSPGISPRALAEAKFSRGLALSENVDSAVTVWLDNPDYSEEYGIKGAFYAADVLADDGRQDRAMDVLAAITSSRSPYHYWVARAFILQSDILKAQGHEFEAREYLRALRQNYPGTETDITVMINQRLPSEQ